MAEFVLSNITEVVADTTPFMLDTITEYESGLCALKDSLER